MLFPCFIACQYTAMTNRPNPNHIGPLRNLTEHNPVQFVPAGANEDQWNNRFHPVGVRHASNAHNAHNHWSNIEYNFPMDALPRKLAIVWGQLNEAGSFYPATTSLCRRVSSKLLPFRRRPLTQSRKHAEDFKIPLGSTQFLGDFKATLQLYRKEVK